MDDSWLTEVKATGDTAKLKWVTGGVRFYMERSIDAEIELLKLFLQAGSAEYRILVGALYDKQSIKYIPP